MRIQPDQETLKKARLQMQGCLTAVILCPGLMAGLDTVRDCMRDDDIRAFLGHALLHEIMPSLGLNREELDPMAMSVCGEMEHPGVVQPLSLLLGDAVQRWKIHALPLLKRYQDREDRIPSCLCMGLACTVMLLAGIRREKDGRFTYIRKDESCALTGDEEILDAFARLSCDMPPETLAYAVLSDRAVWDEDLRDIPALEDRLADQLRNLQVLGLRASLHGAWKDEG